MQRSHITTTVTTGTLSDAYTLTVFFRTEVQPNYLRMSQSEVPDKMKPFFIFLLDSPTIDKASTRIREPWPTSGRKYRSESARILSKLYR